MRLLRAIAIAAAVVSLPVGTAGCYDSFDRPALTDDDPGAVPVANISIAQLIQLCRGETVAITEDLTIAGRVTSSDREGNFYRSFTVEQDGAAVEIMAALNDLHNIWPVGSSVAVRLQGLAMGENMGVKCIGVPAAGYEYLPVGYISSRVELDRIVFRTADPEPFGIPNMYATMLDRTMCGRLVRVVAVVRDDNPDAANEWEGIHLFADDEMGTTVAVSVSPYADFAHRTIPDAERYAITGILQYGRPDGADHDMFVIKPRYESDILY